VKPHHERLEGLYLLVYMQATWKQDTQVYMQSCDT
jgi:hypothetical protein